MVVVKIKESEEKLKEKILKHEKKHIYSSDRFKKIEEKVLSALKKQNTDEALKDITIGALVLGSSDVHYECFDDYVVVRFRIDGVLVDIFKLTLKEYKMVLERLKYSSNLKLNISNIPQDGKYDMLIDERKIDVRVSTLPIKYGENIVSRILDNSNAVVDYEKLGFFWTSKRMIDKATSKKNGMILVTGPTGSGKTTTLYTILSKLNTREKKIITLEDPIEYEVDGIIQSEINEKDGFDFKTGLKALLRQDPDIIMVGEIRDKDTLDTATSASLTGHLVLSTLHTKSAAETLDRIINMGLRPYVLASALDTVIAQRLVRKICPHCKVEKEKTQQEMALIKAIMGEIGIHHLPAKFVKLYKGEGCAQCNHSGYKGRIGIFEILSLTDNMRNMIREGANAEDILKEARRGDFIAMKEDGVLKAIKGFTTIEEILRVI
ncbi:type II/IV secretion system protein [Candidatus Gracilibacteria bacterium 28_42_T64]|nr:type II/IV secretion system protein [Candidatus Gracilibacteria bacterium 28_42_T64]